MTSEAFAQFLDAAGPTQTGQSGSEGSVKVTLDREGRVSTVRTPRAQTHSLSYDEVGLSDKYIPPLIGTYSEAQLWTDDDFDVDRRWSGTLSPDGRNVAVDYDPTSGRLHNLSTAQPVRVLEYGYDPQGRVDRISSLLGYDVLGNPIPDHSGGALTYTYDGFLVLSETWSGGAAAGTVTQAYDNFFRVKDQKLKPCGALDSCPEADLVAAGDDFVYDVDGLLMAAGALSLARDADTGQVVGTTVGSVTTTQQYNGFGELKLTEATYAVTTLLYREEILSRDGMGRITSRRETIGGVATTYGYQYWPMGRLKQVDINGACSAAYTYDANGNRLSTNCGSTAATATYDAQDRLTAQGGTTYGYTLAGRLESRTAGGLSDSYSYDGLGNLLSVVRADGTRVDYSADAVRRRIGKQVNGAPVARWLYQDGLRAVAGLDGNGKLAWRFVYGTGRNVPDYAVAYASDGTVAATYRLVTDHLGSVRLVVNATTGVVLQRLDYDPWGGVLADSSPGLQPFGFAGGIHDHETGLVRFGARDYDPIVGRWTTKDPILFDGGDANLYAYVGNDPINFIDPSGLMAGDCAGAYAAQWYADQYEATGSWYFLLGGAFASLWTPDTSDKTLTVLLGAFGAAKGPEVKIGSDWRVAPFGNRTGNPKGELPHYHRRGDPLPNGQTPPGQGIGRHRPWETKSTDTNFWNRF